MTHRPVGSGVSIATSTTSAQSSAFTCQSNAIRLVASGAGAFVAIGTNPTATVSDYYIPANTHAVLALDIGSQRVVGVTTGTTTIIDFPEGTGSPFDAGETVTLTASSQTYYNFTHATVASVDTSSGVSGYFSTRITLNTNTSGIVTAFNDPDTTLRKSLKVAARTDTGTGTLYAQQIQVTGQA
jgi:hypothetical protein